MRLARAGIAAALALLVAACDTARKLEETQAVNDCARCHGYPPPDPHPQSTSCNTCHSTTVGPDNTTIIAGGTHQNGQVDVTVHQVPYPPSAHGPAADAGPSACTICHGPDYAGGVSGVSCNACHGGFGYADWKTNCTFCHGTRTQGWTDANLPLAAPPAGVAGATAATDPRVGAHQAHLVGTTYVDPLPCATCHRVPERVFPGSLDHITLATELAFTSIATKGVANPGYAGAGGTCAVYCHGTGTEFVNPGAAASTATSPAWISSAALACAGCHGTPPSTGLHGIGVHQYPCNRCHVEVAGSGTTPSIANKTLHVNGTKNVAFSVPGSWDATARTCSNVACHGVNDTRPWP